MPGPEKRPVRRAGVCVSLCGVPSGPGATPALTDGGAVAPTALAGTPGRLSSLLSSNLSPSSSPGVLREKQTAGQGAELATHRNFLNLKHVGNRFYLKGPDRGSPWGRQEGAQEGQGAEGGCLSVPCRVLGCRRSRRILHPGCPLTDLSSHRRQWMGQCHLHLSGLRNQEPSHFY